MGQIEKRIRNSLVRVWNIRIPRSEVCSLFLSRVPVHRTMLISACQVHTCAYFYILHALRNKQTKMGQSKACNLVVCIVCSCNKSDALKIKMCIVAEVQVDFDLSPSLLPGTIYLKHCQSYSKSLEAVKCYVGSGEWKG